MIENILVTVIGISFSVGAIAELDGGGRFTVRKLYLMIFRFRRFADWADRLSTWLEPGNTGKIIAAIAGLGGGVR